MVATARRIIMENRMIHLLEVEQYTSKTRKAADRVMVIRVAQMDLEMEAGVPLHLILLQYSGADTMTMTHRVTPTKTSSTTKKKKKSHQKPPTKKLLSRATLDTSRRSMRLFRAAARVVQIMLRTRRWSFLMRRRVRTERQISENSGYLKIYLA